MEIRIHHEVNRQQRCVINDDSGKPMHLLLRNPLPIELGVPQMSRDKDPQAVGCNGGAKGDQKAGRQPAWLAGEMSAEGKVEAEKTNDKEVHTGTRWSDDQ